MNKRIFITATDTGAGKTHLASGLLNLAAQRGLATIGIKPVASGCIEQQGNVSNEDALTLLNSATLKLHYDDINPYRFLPPIAPHLAGRELEIELTVAELLCRTQFALEQPADLHIIEGFGGWHAPLNSSETMADYAVKLNCEIILVVGIRLGCLNHAILSEKAIIASGGKCIGWIANIIDPDMSHRAENIAALQEILQSELLGVIQFGETADTALQAIRIF